MDLLSAFCICWRQMDRQTDVSLAASGLILFQTYCFFQNQKNTGYVLSSDLLSIYSIKPTETLLANLTRISKPGFVVILCGHRGPGTKKHMGANAYTKKSCYATGGCLWLGRARS